MIEEIKKLEIKRLQSNKALSHVLIERKRQDDLWGQQDHAPMEWLMILGEEVGEANKAALESHFNKKDIYKYRDEMVHVAAVALSAVESFDRQKEGKNGIFKKRKEKIKCSIERGFISETSEEGEEK